EHGADEKQWQRAEKLAEHERFTLERRLYARMLALNLSERIFDVFGRITDRDAGQQIEIDRDAGELIKMIHCLRTNDLRGRCDSAKRNEIGRRSGGDGNSGTPACLAERVPAVASNVQIIQVAWRRALVVFDFENDLVLVLRLFDQIDVV